MFLIEAIFQCYMGCRHRLSWSSTTTTGLGILFEETSTYPSKLASDTPYEYVTTFDNFVPEIEPVTLIVFLVLLPGPTL